MTSTARHCLVALACVCLLGLHARAADAASADGASVSGRVTDETGGALPGVSVLLRGTGFASREALTDVFGGFRFNAIGAGRYSVEFSLINFASIRREIDVTAGESTLNVVLHLTLDAEVTVHGTSTFVNLADVENPAENLVGIAQSASQGAITAAQLAGRPLLRQGEVLETVPGVVVTQHSGTGKANQYFLRGFNLDHGTDFATFVADMPVNMPSHGHGQGYSDLNFLIPELITGVQFSKGPYYAEQGDFATAGASSIRYATVLDRPIAQIDGGTELYSRGLFAISPKIGDGHLLAALEVAHDDGPWQTPDRSHKVNGVARYSRGDVHNAVSLMAMGYVADWTATDQVPLRAIASRLVDRFGSLDSTDGGDTSRFSASGDWQHINAAGTASTFVSAYGIAYDLSLFSNFTYFLNDPVHGDQIQQTDRRFVSGGRVSHRRTARWRDRPIQNTFGVQLRRDDVGEIGLYHTQARARLETRARASVGSTIAGVYAENETSWQPWLRTMTGVRLDGARFTVDAADPANSGTSNAALVSPKGSVTVGPWKATELYVNAGTGFHSNDARGTTITRDASGAPVQRVTPLVRGVGAEIGLRSVALPRLQSTVSLWTLRLDSELVFSGDEAITEASRASERHGIEWANYYRPRRWLVLDADLSWSVARFTQSDPEGNTVPEAVGTVVSAGATVSEIRRTFGSVRWRYFGPRPLTADDSVRSRATSLTNLQAGYRLTKNARLAVDLFNIFNASDSDIDYFYVSRLRGEPIDGVADVHTHPMLPRTARVGLSLTF